MAIVNFRVDEEIKKKMDRLKHLNWSEILRQYVSKVVEEEEKKSLAKKDFRRIKRSIKIIHKLRLRSPKDWKGAEVVMYWRRLRK